MIKTPDQGNGRNLWELDDTYVTMRAKFEIDQKKNEKRKNPSPNNIPKNKIDPPSHITWQIHTDSIKNKTVNKK